LSLSCEKKAKRNENIRARKLSPPMVRASGTVKAFAMKATLRLVTMPLTVSKMFMSLVVSTSAK